MERFKCLGRYQKGVLFIMIAMVLLFTVLYIMAIGREGFEYRNEILLLNHENGKYCIFRQNPGEAGQLYRSYRQNGIFPIRQ